MKIFLPFITFATVFLFSCSNDDANNNITTGAISLTADDVGKIGAKVFKVVDTLPNTISPGTSGKDMVWNFKNLNSHYTDTLFFENPSSTPYSEYFPETDLCIVDKGTEIEYLYLTNTSQSLDVVGLAADFLGVGSLIPLEITKGINQLVFPSTFTDGYEGHWITDLTVDGSSLGVDSVRMKSHVERMYHIDAFGTVQLPDGVFDALRVKVDEEAKDSTWILVSDTWTLSDTATSKVTGYDWWTDDDTIGFPLVKMDVENGNVVEVEYIKRE